MRHHRRRVLGAVLAALLAAAALSAQTGRRVSGTVLSATTQLPVIGASVRYTEAGQAPQTTTTDSKGYFEFPSPGQLGVVTVTARDFGTARRRWPPLSGSGQLRVDLMPPATLHGTVTDLVTGRPLPASVRVIVQHPGNLVSRTVAAEKGVFVVEDLPAGPVLLVARSEGFAHYVGSTTVEAGKVRDTRVGLLLESRIGGQVVGSDGEPVEGAYVSATYPELAGAGLVESFIGGFPTTQPDGAFNLNGLMPDTTIALQAELDGRRSSVETISVGPGMQRAGIVLTLP